MDPNYPAAEDEPGWDYRREVEADLNGDGAPEHILVTARAERSPANPNEYLWDDGQPWQVLVTSPQGDKTLVYSPLGPNRPAAGHRWGEPQNNGHQPLIILELSGTSLSVYKVEYTGPKQADARRLLEIPVVNQAGPAPLPWIEAGTRFFI